MAVLLMSITVSTGWAVVGGLSLVFVLLFLLAGVFGPMPRYTISSRGDISDNDSEMFLNVLESLTDAKINRAGTLEVLTNGRASTRPHLTRCVRLSKASAMRPIFSSGVRLGGSI